MFSGSIAGLPKNDLPHMYRHYICIYYSILENCLG